MEIDLVPIPENSLMSDLIDGTIGEESEFHKTYGYYAHGVGINTAIFPEGWEQRLISLHLDMGDGEITVFFPSVEDIVLSKYAAGRDKDLFFIRKVDQEGLIDKEKLRKLLPRLQGKRLGKEKTAFIADKVKKEILLTNSNEFDLSM